MILQFKLAVKLADIITVIWKAICLLYGRFTV